MGTPRSKKMIAGLVLASTAGVGGLAAAAVSPLGTVGAASGPSTTVAATSADPGTTAGREGRGGRGDHGPGQVLQEALDQLVADGTLTQAQADKVTGTVKLKAAAAREEHQAEHEARRKEFADTVAKALGITADELTTALEDGSTLAEIATSKGVDVQKVVDALVAAENAGIDQAVEDGRLTEAQAAERKSRVTERVTEMVNNGPRHGGPGGRRGGPGGPGGFGGRHGGPEGGPEGGPSTDDGGN